MSFSPIYRSSICSPCWRTIRRRQIWFAMRFTGEDSEVDLEHHEEVEFDAWRWADIDEAMGLVVPFKREAYAQVIATSRSPEVTGLTWCRVVEG